MKRKNNKRLWTFDHQPPLFPDSYQEYFFLIIPLCTFFSQNISDTSFSSRRTFVCSPQLYLSLAAFCSPSSLLFDYYSYSTHESRPNTYTPPCCNRIQGHKNVQRRARDTYLVKYADEKDKDEKHKKEKKVCEFTNKIIADDDEEVQQRDRSWIRLSVIHPLCDAIMMFLYKDLLPNFPPHLIHLL